MDCIQLWCSFVSYAELSQKQKEELKANQLVKVIDDGNLFLITNPLVKGKDECEIEDLFNEITRSHIINGKSFSKNDKADIEKYYGKEIFADYIQASYQNIDFVEFKPILNNIKKVITDYSGEAEIRNNPQKQ